MDDGKLDALGQTIVSALPGAATAHSVAFNQLTVDVEVGKDSTVIQLTLYNADPDIAKRALDLLVDDFLLQQARIGRDPQVGFAQSQVAVYRKQVADAQNVNGSYGGPALK